MHFKKTRVLLFCLTLFSITSLTADLKSHVKYGLAPLQDHEIHHLENNVHKVIGVSPNDIGLNRLQIHVEGYEADSQEETGGTEFNTLQVPSNHALGLMLGSSPLPSAIDNSKLPSFPPIGNQGSLESCVAWGSTYYQASHEIALARGLNNKSSSQHILSPKWTYNLINQGSNAGSSPVDAYQLLTVNGAASLSEFPYDNNYTAWDLNPQDWISAIYNRMNPCTLIPGLGGSGPQNLTAIKQSLTNGHVLTFASFIDSWVFTKIKSGPHVGEYAAYWMNGTNGGHFMTIVGYDDNVWIDINNNGVVDQGEKGAFLVANSWGPTWGNNGFMWISYDAFLDHSLVKDAPNLNRVAAGTYLNSCLISATPKAINYIPKLIAQFSLTQAFRNEINIKTGISTTGSTTPTSHVIIPAFANEGGSFEFNGAMSNAPETATFAIDLTDLIPQTNNQEASRYYLLVNDNKAGHPTILHSFSLLDLIHNQKTNTLFNLPKVYDNSGENLYIDYTFKLAN